jgi:hypothetical protein
MLKSMPKRRKQLVIEFLENVKREVLEDYQQLIREYIKGKTGVYALYRGDRLKYVGLATDLRNRLKNHLTDRHAQSWDKFSVFLTVDDEHLREMEALVIGIAKPKENLTKTKFRKAENLKFRFRRDIRRFQKKELDALFGDGDVDFEPYLKNYPAKRAKRKVLKIDKQPTLAPFIKSRMKIFAPYKGKTYSASVLSTGKIKLNNKIFNSPSWAGKEITKKQTDGWIFWKYKDPKTKKLVLLDNLRK